MVCIFAFDCICVCVQAGAALLTFTFDTGDAKSRSLVIAVSEASGHELAESLMIINKNISRPTTVDQQIYDHELNHQLASNHQLTVT